MNIAITLLSYEDKSFVGKDGKAVDYKEAIARYNGKIFKFSSKVDLKKYLDTDCQVEIEIVPDFAMKPKVRIVDLA